MMPAPLPEAELIARLTLHALPKIGSKRFLQLLHYFGNAQQALANQSAWQQAGLPASCQRINSHSVAEVVENNLAWLADEQQHILFWDSPLYPALLKEISDPPPVLFVKGDSGILDTPQLAMVGSRHASKPGLENSFQFAKTLAGAGLTITSGLALGIDGAAHAGALAGTGLTIAVLGCGLNHLYPASHKALANRIVANGGAIISELPLDTAPQAANFPRRNRIISGLALATLVVEATLSSGSLITAKLAAEQGREVLAIPGSIQHPMARGCHQLIREGATLVESVAHILEALRGWQNIDIAVPELATPDQTTDTTADLLLTTLRACPQSAEALAISLNIAFAEVLIALTELELAGKVTCDAGLWYAF